MIKLVKVAKVFGIVREEDEGMRCATGRSIKNNVREAIREATIEISDAPVLIIFSADEEYFKEYSALLMEKFPKSIVLGSTSYIHMCEKGYSKYGISLVAIFDIKCCGGVIEEAGRFPGKYIKKFEKNLSKISEHENSLCFEFCALSYYCEELFLDRLHDSLKEKNIPLFGGSAGSYISKDNAKISYNGKVYTESTAYIFIYGDIKINFYKENIFKPTKHKFLVTDVEVSDRIVYEYDNVPAAKMLARILGTDINSMQSLLTDHPMGRVVDDDIYITDHNCIVRDGGLEYYANIYNNTRMIMLEPDNYRKVFKETIERIHNDVGIPDFSIVFSCYSRSLRFERDNYMDEFFQGLCDGLGNYICFSGYGEQLYNHHLNQTMLIVTFSK